MRILNAIIVSSLVTFGTTVAQADDEEHSSTHSKDTTPESSVSGVRLSSLMDSKIQSSDGENLGELEDLLIDPQTGQVKFAVLGRGGFLGFGEKHVPVPWKAIQVKSEREFTLNVDKEKLKEAPTTDKEYSNLTDPGYTVTVYRFFAIPAPTAVGGADTPEDMESETGWSADEPATDRDTTLDDSADRSTTDHESPDHDSADRSSTDK